MKAFWQSILAAAIGGAATTVANVLVDPHVISEPSKLGTIAGAGALIGVAGLLKQSPVTPAAPKDVKE